MSDAGGLDLEMLEQLKGVFARLENPVTLRIEKGGDENPQSAELEQMLKAVASASPNVKVEHGPRVSPGTAPAFEILRGTPGVQRTGIRFRAIPGGHEFSSLVLAILHADGKGKLPDEAVTQRIRALRGPIRLRTYMSLSCENCPEVVQALNLMAALHPDFEHTTIDGALAQDEVTALAIQGVPAVVAPGASESEWSLLHSGKIALIDLLAKLEARFGKNEAAVTTPKDLGRFDVVVVGGGPAGASAAIYSVRKGLSTVVLAERFGGQLQDTKGIENMISKSYTEGVRLSAELAEHLGKYPVRLLEHRRVSRVGPRDGEGYRRVDLEGGETLEARTLIVATGAKWRELGVPGEKEHIGQGVAFCAHCDGPFYKQKRVVVVGGGNSGVEAAIDLSAIATHVTLLEFNTELKADGVLVEKLKTLGNVVVHTGARTTRVVGEGGKVVGLEYEDRESGQVKRLDVDGVFVQIGLLPNSQFVKGIVETTPYGEIVVDSKGRTNAPGIYAAGDVTTVPFKQIVIAMGEGAKVALAAFEDRMREAPTPPV